ncbi:MAG: hypothetical protein KDD66_02120 [Bdellovibrionales bacterium]|nr:hypothetical protein [Bdellovibrionales bacterium]
MARKPLTAKEKKLEKQFKQISELFISRGIQVRREKLSRGPAFRVKSGDCAISGDNYIFVDRRLPIEQQSSVLIDYIPTIKESITEEELESLPRSARVLMDGDLSDSAPVD